MKLLLKINFIVFLTLAIISYSCNSTRKLERQKKRKAKRSLVVPNNIVTKQETRTETFEEIQSKALSYYKSASFYENQYYKDKNTLYAEIAIEKYEKYYALLPNGSYAGLALLKKAELYYRIDKKELAVFELNRIKRRYDLKSKYLTEIKLIEDLIF